MRKAINLLQTARQLNGSAALEENQIVEIAGLAPPNALEALWAAVKSNQGKKVTDAVDELVHNGYPALTLLQQVYIYTSLSLCP